MNEFSLKYGCNPNQKPARIFMANGGDLPVEILCGRPGYINFLDAFNSWQLVKELKGSDRPSGGGSFKACQSGGRGGWPAADGRSAQDLFRGRRGAFPAGLCLCESARRGPHVLLRRFYRAVRLLRRADCKAHRAPRFPTV